MANQAARSLKIPSTSDGYNLARALAIACAEDDANAELPELIEAARSTNSDVGFQILGLLARVIGVFGHWVAQAVRAIR